MDQLCNFTERKRLPQRGKDVIIRRVAAPQQGGKILVPIGSHEKILQVQCGEYGIILVSIEGQGMQG